LCVIPILAIDDGVKEPDRGTIFRSTSKLVSLFAKADPESIKANPSNLAVVTPKFNPSKKIASIAVKIVARRRSLLKVTILVAGSTSAEVRRFLCTDVPFRCVIAIAKKVNLTCRKIKQHNC
jgi:hypothetical protein